MIQVCLFAYKQVGTIMISSLINTTIKKYYWVSLAWVQIYDLMHINCCCQCLVQIDVLGDVRVNQPMPPSVDVSSFSQRSTWCGFGNVEVNSHTDRGFSNVEANSHFQSGLSHVETSSNFEQSDFTQTQPVQNPEVYTLFHDDCCCSSPT